MPQFVAIPALALASMLALTLPLIAQPRPVTAEHGREIAERLCTNCHLTNTQRSSTAVPVGSPTFADIANKPDQTYERVVGMMLQPHQPMPDIQLTREEILNLVAYLDSLRRKDLPPLREPKGDDLPKPTAPAKT